MSLPKIGKSNKSKKSKSQEAKSGKKKRSYETKVISDKTPRTKKKIKTKTKESDAYTLKKDASIEEIVAAMLKDKTLTKPIALMFFSNDGHGQKRSIAFFNGLNDIVKANNAYALNRVFDSYKVDVTGSDVFKKINKDTVAIFVVVGVDKKILAKAGGLPMNISSEKSFKTLCDAAKVKKVDLKTAVNKQKKLLTDILAYDMTIHRAKFLLDTAVKNKASKRKISKYQKAYDKAKTGQQSLLSEEKKLWQDIQNKMTKTKKKMTKPEKEMAKTKAKTKKEK